MTGWDRGLTVSRYRVGKSQDHVARSVQSDFDFQRPL